MEQKNRTLLNVARALHFQSSIPISFWGDCLLTATYLFNRTPSALLNGMSPYQILFGKSPSYSHLKIFGCLCYATVVPHPTDKFAPRAIRVFMGYPYAKKGYKILDLEMRYVFISQDVNFVETMFPFKDIISINSPQLFPSQSTCYEEDPLSLSPTPSHQLDTSPTHNSAHEISQCTQSLQPTTPSILPARPQRVKHIPAKFSDYTGLPTHLANQIHVQYTHEPQNSYPLDYYIPNLSFDPSYVHFLANINKIPEPQTYKQAVKHTYWCEAMNVELAALEANHTWDIMPLPDNKKVVDCKWLYKVKYHSNGEVDRYKARLIAKGFTQTQGLDFFETFSLVTKMATLQIVLTLAAKFH